MILHGLRTVRGRLWAALAMLSLAVLCVSAVSWFALQRVDVRLQALHQETLSQVALALDLSKRSADLATSAPFLLNQRSNFLVQQEGEKLKKILDQVKQGWPSGNFGLEAQGSSEIASLVASMDQGITDLVNTSSRLDALHAEIRVQTGAMGALRREAADGIEQSQFDSNQQVVWWLLQSMNADALNAAYAGNLIGVGEEQRHYQRQRMSLTGKRLSSRQTAFLTKLEASVWGNSGIFELRRLELSQNLLAQNALFRIRFDANQISELAIEFANGAEMFLASERAESSSTISFTRLLIAMISISSLCLALAAAVYVSRYVTSNISRVSNAMVRLADGDRASILPRRIHGSDEIADLFRSFRTFRANALKLDRTNRLLDQRNALFEKVFVNFSDGIAITDPSGRLTAFNPAFETIIKPSEEIKNRGGLVGWLKASRFANAARSADISVEHRGFCELTADDGQILELRASKLPDDSRVWLVTDVTERRRMADRLQQIDRIETLGKVAGDTAHDFANVLSSIRTHAHLLKPCLDDKETDRLSAIENAVDFGSNLTERLLAFARKQNLAPETVDLNVLVEGMADLVQISLKENVDLLVSTHPSPVLVQVDPGQFESALFNILINANQAIEDVGQIDVAIALSDENTACLRIQDDGIGMDEEIQSHAIEPFYTTKDESGGTGLGLSIVYGFIRQTGGDLNIQSVPGQGTLIEVMLPLVSTESDCFSVKSSSRALVAEDDHQTRERAVKLLQHAGFEVSEATSGGTAMRLIVEKTFDFVLTDIELGDHINGYDLARRLRELHPDCRVVLMSGKAQHDGVKNSEFRLIEKPLTAAKLKQALQGLVEATYEQI